MRKVLVGIIPNPYTERRCGNGKPKEKYTDEVLRYGRRKAADRREDEAASHKAVWGITVTRNEILTALNKPEEYLLAIVEVDGEHTRATYLRRPFGAAPDMGACSVNYQIAELMRVGEREE